MPPPSTCPPGEIPAGILEYEVAKLEAQRVLDDLSMSLHEAIDAPCEAGEASGEQVAVVALTSVRLEGEGDYLFRRGVYAVPAGLADDLIRWGRVRPATEAEIEAHNERAKLEG